ncbi:MAG: tRNA (N6-isopentenyl adenosine(37)-C2)-methylthiotransferase MiaB [Candidatus Omnitrophota bacterium]
MNKKFFIRTFGCQMNVRDSEVICGLLRTMNYELTTNAEEADVIIFNTCSVRKHAEDKVWSELGRFKCDKRYAISHKPIIGLVGCMAQAYKDKIFERAPWVDFVVGPSDIHKIPQIVEKITNYKSQIKEGIPFELKIWEIEGNERPEEIYHTGFYQDKDHAYVIISEGCSNYCSYCIVPYVRGPLRNRDYKDILREIEEAVDKGITRITLLGQNVNAYISSAKLKAQSEKLKLKTQVSNNEINFINLLEMVNGIKGLKEFSFITSHPKDVSVDLFYAMAECDKLKKHLHLPLQSGSDRILRLMNRGYTKKLYLDLVNKYRKIIKDGVLTTDIIVGFPTESEADFQETYNLVKEIEFNAGFIFKYSPRPHTAAEKLPDDVCKEEKERRQKLVLDLQKKISLRKNEKK